MSLRISEAQAEQFIREGYLVARGLLPRESVERVRAELLDAMGIDPGAPATWEGKTLSSDPAVLALTAQCRTAAVEVVAEQLAGPHFVRGLCHSPYLEARGVSPALIPGYIPVLNFP